MENIKVLKKPKALRRRGLPASLKSGKMQALNYNDYHFSLKDRLELLAVDMGFILLIGYLFYNSIWVLPLAIPALFVITGYEKRRRMAARQAQLGYQFKDAIVLLYSFVATGNTLEHAFRKAARDLTLSYDRHSDIIREFEEITRKLDRNITVEACMDDFARRSGHEDIQSFSEVIAIAKRGGGSMTAIIKNSVDAIKSKIEIENEIATIISGKKNEFRLMVIIPAAVILYMRLFSGGFMNILYENMGGHLIMTLCLMIYAGAIFWGNHILDIHV